jgi:hypothetical protein
VWSSHRGVRFLASLVGFHSLPRQDNSGVFSRPPACLVDCAFGAPQLTYPLCGIVKEERSRRLPCICHRFRVTSVLALPG